MKKRTLSILLSLCLAVTLVTPAVAAEPVSTEATEVNNTLELTEDTTDFSYVVEAPTTITVDGNVTLTGEGDAFTINADTTLVFEDGASLTLSGYTNGFVVSNALVESGNMTITATSTMDVFRLKTNGKLELSGSSTITGSGKTGTTNRALVLESGEGQAITLTESATLTATNFYRGLETGGAKHYTISGAGMDSSEFDFSDNNCGMALSYFDSDAHFEDCTLEVSNCDASGIFMRQDNAALDGLYIDNVKINCVNDPDLNQEDIAIRFHSNNFAITNSIINIENAWNTGMWIFDGWNENEQNKIIGTDITVKNVMPKSDGALYGNALRSKAITVVPYREWLIKDCNITMEGTEDSTSTQGGLNIANDTQISVNGINITAKPNMYGGTIVLEGTEITSRNLKYAEIGVQIGQFVKVGQNVVIENDHSDSDWTPHFTILCDTVDAKFPVQILGTTLRVSYNTSGMTTATMADDRVVTTGGNYWSSNDENLEVYGIRPYNYSLPNNGSGDELTMFAVTPAQYAAYFDESGSISLMDSTGTSYDYTAQNASSDGNRYIWAYAATVTFSTGETAVVPCGTPFGMFGTLPEGNWTLDGQPFTSSSVVTGDITVAAAQ